MNTLRSTLATWALGPACPHCGERRRGPRALAKHMWLDHGDAS